MATDTRSASEIERDIEQERAQFRDTAQQLQDRFSPDRLLGDLGRELRDYGSDYGRSVARVVRDNPVGLALTGIGLAWLAFGGRAGGADHSRGGGGVYGRSAAGHGRRADPMLLDDEDYAGGYDPNSYGPNSYGTDSADSSFPSWAREDDHYSDPWAGGDAGGQGALGRAGDVAGDVAGRAPDGAAGWADSAGSAAGGAYASAREHANRLRQGAQETGADFQARISRLRARLAEGTEDLSDSARERVIAARARAVEARDKARRAASQGGAAATEFFRDQPLVAGALALAAGAALGSALPRSRTEDRWMGAYSDSLFDEAESIYREERAKLERVAEAAGEEAKDIADEAGKALKQSAEAAREKAGEAADRIGEAAKDEADRQDLGRPHH
ncbi:DUF3618 domain-containing protein [Rhodobacteraceae bacterium 2CG4]|uniref:DUF3618 domain-containing protein n=1 Tax=Halovulum marinum TaxID=2662447 RepID=A0A6L5YX22_9RHOB|nr:DUF3618 domain-containing protein [Halovulum marinum]MSU88881.1 DUF3618 domain-containing protein [Halovulum marinum]